MGRTLFFISRLLVNTSSSHCSTTAPGSHLNTFTPVVDVRVQMLGSLYYGLTAYYLLGIMGVIVMKCWPKKFRRCRWTTGLIAWGKLATDISAWTVPKK